VIENRGQRLSTDGDLTLTKKAIDELIHLALTPENQLQDVKINDVFSKDFFESNFWLYWCTMFAFEPWASAMEMRRYILRFVHHVGTLSNLSSLRFTKYNQYESLIMPLVKNLESQGVHFHYNSQVKNILVNSVGEKKVATKIEYVTSGKEQQIDLTENDLVFVTNGSITESTTYGDDTHPAPPTHDLGGSWQLWKNLAEQDPAFGKPGKFCDNIPPENWFVSGTITLKDDKVTPYIEKISKKIRTAVR